MMQRISKEELAQHLVHQVAIADDLTPDKALDTLLYGWKKFRHFGQKYLDALKHREWLYIVEVQDLSEYAGYDLTQK